MDNHDRDEIPEIIEIREWLNPEFARLLAENWKRVHWQAAVTHNWAEAVLGDMDHYLIEGWRDHYDPAHKNLELLLVLKNHHPRLYGELPRDVVGLYESHHATHNDESALPDSNDEWSIQGSMAAWNAHQSDDIQIPLEADSEYNTLDSFDRETETGKEKMG